MQPSIERLFFIFVFVPISDTKANLSYPPPPHTHTSLPLECGKDGLLLYFVMFPEFFSIKTIETESLETPALDIWEIGTTTVPNDRYPLQLSLEVFTSMAYYYGQINHGPK